MIVTLRTRTPSRGARAKRMNEIIGQAHTSVKVHTRMPQRAQPVRFRQPSARDRLHISGGLTGGRYPSPVTSRTDSMVSSAITFARSALEDITSDTSASDMPW